MPSINNIELSNGLEISFKTFNQCDTWLKRGIIKGIVGYDLAKTAYDVVNYHLQVQETLGGDNLLTPAEHQEYIMIETPSNIIMSYALDWIDPATLTVITNITPFNITITNQEDPTNVLTLLVENGIAAKLAE